MPPIHSFGRDENNPSVVEVKIKLHELICETDNLLRKVATDDPRYQQLVNASLEKLRRATQPVRFGYECKVVRWYGSSFHFTDNQAEVVRILRKIRELGLPRIHERSILEMLKVDDELNSTKYRLNSRFRVGKGYHQAIGEMIIVNDGWWRIP